MSNEPIPDEFGSWARLLPTPEAKQPVVEKAAAEAVPATQGVEEHPVIESAVRENGAEETATLAFISDQPFADDEPLFALAPEARAAAEPVTADEAAHEIVPEEKPLVEGMAHTVEAASTPEPLMVEKPTEDKPADEKAPAEAVADKTEVKTVEEPALTQKAGEHTPATERVSAPAVIDEKVKRPFRVKLRGSLLVLVRLPNKRTIQGSFHQLSTSGGVIHFEKPLDEKLEVELIFHLKETTIRSKGQMLFPMWATQGWMQPFRFVNLADDNRRVLNEGLKSFVGDLAKGASAGA